MKSTFLSFFAAIVLVSSFTACKHQQRTFFEKKIIFKVSGELADHSTNLGILPTSMQGIGEYDNLTIDCPDTMQCGSGIVLRMVGKLPPGPQCSGCRDFTLKYIGGNNFMMIRKKDNFSGTFSASRMNRNFLSTIRSLKNNALTLEPSTLKQ